MEIERPEIVELFYSALFGHADVEQLFRFEELIQFLSPRVEWIMSAVIDLPIEPAGPGARLFAK